MEANELLERYVHDVGRRLPRKGREDIQKELYSLLQDTLDERSQGEPRHETAIKILHEFGPPEQMAAQYREAQYLIGPGAFPIFRTVATIVLTVISVLFLLLLGLILWNGAGEAGLGSVIWSWMLTYLRTAATALASVTVVFVVLERLAPHEFEADSAAEDWDPIDLPPVNDPDGINRGELIAEVVAGVIFYGLLLALLSSDLISSFIVPSFWPEIGWIGVSVAVELLLQVTLLWRGRRNVVTHWLDIANELFGLYVLYRIVSGPITTIGGVTIAIKVGLIVAMIAIAISAIIKLAGLIWRRHSATVYLGARRRSG